MNISLVKQKAIFFGGHIMASLLLLALPLFLMTCHYYPDYLFETDGGFEVMKIALLIDVILGPVLGAIVYMKGKKTLKMDLALIFILQISAFAYGLYTMYENRPFAQVVYRHVIWTMKASQVEGNPSPNVLSILNQKKSPLFVFEAGLHGKDLVDNVNKYIERGRAIYIDSARWHEIPGNSTAEKEAFDINRLAEPSRKRIRDHLVRYTGTTLDTKASFAVYAYMGRFKKGFVIVNLNSGAPVEFIDEYPGVLIDL